MRLLVISRNNVNIGSRKEGYGLEIDVYNLEFPYYVKSISIENYQFSRVENYQEKLQNLQYPIPRNSEFSIRANTGSHSVTAKLYLQNSEAESILYPNSDNATALDDILVLLSLMTGRNVFVDKNKTDSNEPKIILADSRVYKWGGSLRASIPFKRKNVESESLDYPFGYYDIGFEESVNGIYSLMKSQEWKQTYQNGFFLVLTREAFSTHSVESTFVQCWTIWEHLFSILNQNWLPASQLHRISSAEKIAFLLFEFILSGKNNEQNRKRIETLSTIRNRLVHFGRFPDKDAIVNDAVLFIRLTEQIVTKILGLSPSNVFITMEKLEEFLQQNKT